ncbi:MAG TPA: EAL domain-containing protein, partial [Thermoanaerobaculia bacterium]|nr:EAL domain-containing protein [Thermoanaerobaculia bacterium]
DRSNVHYRVTDPRQPFHLVPGGRPEGSTELARLRAEIEARDRQETAIAELGQAALTGVDPYILLGQACALVELTLAVDHCRVLEITPSGRTVLRASIGSNDSFNHCERDDEENESVAMYVAVAGAPVIFTDLVEETRFKSSHLRHYHGIRGGAGVVIPAASGVFGVLLAYSSAERLLAEYEIAFLRSTASLIGEALERYRTEQALRKSESRLKQLIDSTLDAVVTVDRDGHVIEWNPQAEAIFGMKARDVLGRPLPGDVMPATAGAQRRVEALGRRASGEQFPIEITIDPVGSGSEQTFTAFIRDISERRRAQDELERREQRFRALVEKSWSGVVLLDQSLAFSYAGASTDRLLGYSESDLLGASILGFVHPRERHTARQLFADLLEAPNREFQGEIRFLHKNGTWVWLEGFTQNLLHDPSVGAIVVNYRDITQRKATEKQLEYQAYYDALTGLPNRLLFRDRVVTAIAQAQRNRRALAVMYLDLDHFKLVNDGLGHSVGDKLLGQVAERLATSVRASDTISRLGGDEFTLLLNDVDSSDAVAGVARKILHSLARPFKVDGHELFVTASIGISLFPNDGDDVEILLKSADSAMYRAKELGRNQAQLFTASMNERYVRRLAIEQSLHHALERRELELHYQPVYDRMRRPVSVEALIRWNHPTRGLVPPADFISLAEETGLIVPIGEWVVREVCAQLRRWHDAGLTALKAALNISAPQLQQPTFTRVVVDTLQRNNLAPSSLQIEITESVAVQNIDLILQVLQELKQYGVGIAIDDFGTGQSSLLYLKRFPIDTVKIDKTFIQDVTTDDSAAAIVSYVISLAHTLRFEVVAEGVETEEQYAFLRLNGCDRLQGFLFSPARPANEIEALIKQ